MSTESADASPCQEHVRDHILKIAEQRGPKKTFCPSEVARAMRDSNWRTLMPTVWDAIHTLYEAGHIQVEQSGEAVDPAKTSGPVRLRTSTRQGTSAT
jgi:hypothetical protein